MGAQVAIRPLSRFDTPRTSARVETRSANRTFGHMGGVRTRRFSGWSSGDRAAAGASGQVRAGHQPGRVAERGGTRVKRYPKRSPAGRYRSDPLTLRSQRVSCEIDFHPFRVDLTSALVSRAEQLLNVGWGGTTTAFLALVKRRAEHVPVDCEGELTVGAH